ncbi:MAG TPA: hypothetical protein VIC07_00450 [Acidimicrobiia bacterium]
MSRDLDTIARQAAERLRAAVESAPLRAEVPVVSAAPRRPSLRLVLVTTALLLSSAVAVALVAEIDPPPATRPTTTTSTTIRLDSATLSGVIPYHSVTTTIPPTTTSAPTTTVAADTTPPPLDIIEPRDGAELDQPEVVFRGTTEPGATVWAGKYQAEVDPDGSWSIVLILSKGANRVGFTARDEAGNETEARVTVNYLVMEETTTSTTKPDEEPIDEPAEFVANASFGVCTLTPPFDVYYGKGEPGSTVHVQSEHGSGEVTVGEDGQWEIQVFFPEAPPGQGFLVTVFDDLGREKVFEFVYQPEG